MNGPSPNDPHPMKGFPQVGFLKPLVKNPNVVVGEYTYYDDPDGPEHFEAKCVLYHFDFIGDFSRHYGIFAGCGTSLAFASGAAAGAAAACAPGGGSGGCC